MRRTRSWLRGEERAKLGSVSTWENADRKTLVLHRIGPMREAFSETIGEVLALDPTFRLVCYSTPDTILTDLQGNRRDFVNDKGDSTPVALPEVQALARVGRRDLIHPRLNRPTRDRRIDTW
jgi:hypothetical protein